MPFVEDGAAWWGGVWVLGGGVQATWGFVKWCGSGWLPRSRWHEHGLYDCAFSAGPFLVQKVNGGNISSQGGVT